MVVVLLMGMVLAVAWNVNHLVLTVNRQNEREAYLSHEVRTPLMFIDKLIMQNSEIEGTSTDNRISFFTDANLDDVRERNVIEVVGNELRLTTWNTTGSKANIEPPTRETVLSTNNANLDPLLGGPLFTYLEYDSSGNLQAITDQGEYAGDTRCVRTTIIAVVDGEAMSDSRLTYLRNRD